MNLSSWGWRVQFVLVDQADTKPAPSMNLFHVKLKANHAASKNGLLLLHFAGGKAVRVRGLLILKSSILASKRITVHGSCLRSRWELRTTLTGTGKLNHVLRRQPPAVANRRQTNSPYYSMVALLGQQPRAQRYLCTAQVQKLYGGEQRQEQFFIGRACQCWRLILLRAIPDVATCTSSFQSPSPECGIFFEMTGLMRGLSAVDQNSMVLPALQTAHCAPGGTVSAWKVWPVRRAPQGAPDALQSLEYPRPYNRSTVIVER